MGNLESRVAKLEAQKGQGVAVVNMAEYPGMSQEEAQEQHLREHPQDAGAELWVFIRDIKRERDEIAAHGGDEEGGNLQTTA